MLYFIIERFNLHLHRHRDPTCRIARRLCPPFPSSIRRSCIFLFLPPWFCVPPPPPSSIWNLKGKLFCRVGWTLDFGQIPRNSHQHIGPRLLLWHTRWLRGSCASSRQAQGRNLENGAETETVEELCSLTCFSWFTQPAFLYSSGLHRSHDSRWIWSVCLVNKCRCGQKLSAFYVPLSNHVTGLELLKIRNTAKS